MSLDIVLTGGLIGLAVVAIALWGMGALWGHGNGACDRRGCGTCEHRAEAADSDHASLGPADCSGS